MKKISTEFSETMDRNHPLDGTPNPYFERENTLNLNGYWEFAIDESTASPEKFPDKILVPFSVETPLSGIERHVAKNEYMHYRKDVFIPEEYRSMKGRLVFEAIDQEAKVYVDGVLVATNDFGYGIFDAYFDVAGREEVTIDVLVHDDTGSPFHARGKQSEEPGGIWYTPTSGIWGSVSLEFVPLSGFIKKVEARPLFDESKVEIKASFEGFVDAPYARVYFDGRLLGEKELDGEGKALFDLSDSFYPWDADHPNLYRFEVSDGEDAVRSLFAFRKVEKIVLGGIPFLMLNGKPLYLSALLDQGYYPESGLTPPSVEAMRFDILEAKKAGFNCLRKHIKIEPMRWYYLCDTLGMPVIQDFINGGDPYSKFWISSPLVLQLPLNDRHPKVLGRSLLASRKSFESEMKKTFEQLKCVPSILIWTLFNEGWGQFETKRLTALLKSWDDARLIDATSGWYDKGAGDFSSHHIYFLKLRLHKDKRKRILSLSEFGGYGLPLKEHMSTETAFGYKHFADFSSLNAALAKLYGRVLHLVEKVGLSVSVYTELTDVEQEVNGLLTYDRKIEKVDFALLRRLNAALYSAYRNLYIQKGGVLPHD